jgi:hypothetical protein
MFTAGRTQKEIQFCNIKFSNLVSLLQARPVSTALPLHVILTKTTTAESLPHQQH